MEQSYFLIGNFKVYFYGVFMTIGGILGYLLAKKRLQKFQIKENVFDDLFILLIPVAIIGARIYHLFSSFSFYRNNPTQIFNFRQGGLGIYGAILADIALIYLWSLRKKINFWNFLDLIAPSILLMQAVGRIGNFFNQEVIGPPTNLPWKFFVSLSNRPPNFQNFSFFHPVFLYEAVFSLLFLLLFLFLEKRLKPKPGFSFGFYLFTYGLLRFFLEFWRFDTWIYKTIKIGYFFAIGMIVIGLKMISNGLRGRKLIK